MTDQFDSERGLPRPDLTAFVRIAGRKVHETGVEQGLARWIDCEAQRIIQEMCKGRSMIARIQTVRDGLPRDTKISAEGFDDALAAYRQTTRRTQGFLKQVAAPTR